MRNFKLANNVLGAIVFVIAAFVYLSTIESSVSLWDCGEFIASAFKLEVGHPPGAPFFMLIANIFSHLTGTEQAARMVNSMSALCSALTILFLFWSITHMTRRLLIGDGKEQSIAQNILILGSGLVGALAYTFSDTFWFSAVEGEVYATSSLFTAVVFWLILKWEEHADAPHADKWIILIAYLMGLSIGVHLLNLLCIPAIVLVYYYKKFPNPTLKGMLYALLISFVMVAFMLYGIVQGLVEVCGWFELFFVNFLGMPYNSGVFAYVVAIAAVLFLAIRETMRDEVKPVRMKIMFIVAVTLLGIPFIGNGYTLGVLIIAALSIFIFRYKKLQVKTINTILVSLFVIVIGYSSFALILIRATADTPMNQNCPQDIFTLRSYLAREQYGETPLFYGKTYVSEVQRRSDGRYCVAVTHPTVPTRTRVIKNSPAEKDRYIITSENERPEYVKETCMLFPRMYSNTDASHVSGYKEWGNVTGRTVRYTTCGEAKTVTMPTFGENLRFFFNYQLNYMYWRYFMWNFSGRQNDVQSFGSLLDGNWITGISFLDEMRLGPQDNLPNSIANNKGHNKFYMLPLLLGIIGIIFQVTKKENVGIQSFWITFMLFFMTGIAIVLYLNQTPYQPRERDYAYAGSFYAFCIWIGIGVAGVAKLLEKAKLSSSLTNVIASVVCLLVPVQMASQTWDDHDRSGRYVARDIGRNYLESCDPNAIIFTHGDNDTFPLWYVQEVEGIRTDVRVCNTSYLQTDWYINQMKRQAYFSEPLPISWNYSQYIQGKRDYIYIMRQTDQPLKASSVLEMIKSDDPKFKRSYGTSTIDYIPTSKLAIPIDSASVVNSNTVSPDYFPYIAKEMNINYEGKDGITKLDAMMLEMVNGNKWKRPIYVAITVPSSIWGTYGNYIQQTGLALQIVPFTTNDNDMRINTKKMYDNVMNKFKWGGLEKTGLYIDEKMMNMCKSQRTYLFADLANALIKENKLDSAHKVLDRCVEVMPEENIPYDFSMASIASLYLKTGQPDKGKSICEKVLADYISTIEWILRLKPSLQRGVMDELERKVSYMRYLLTDFYQYDKTFAESYMERWNGYYNQLTALKAPNRNN